MEEIWKDIPGFEDRYQVSNMYRIKSLSRIIYTNNGSYISKEKILKSYIDEGGYSFVRLSKGKRNSKFKQFIHRAVSLAFIPNPENKPEVNHKKGIKTDNRVENLEWVTHSENIKHADINGLRKMPKGIKHHKCKLTEKQVLEIRNKYIPRKYTTRMLAKEYNVVQGTICFILNNKHWTHI